MIQPFIPDDVAPYPPSCLDIETASDGAILDIGFCYTDMGGETHYSVHRSIEAFLHHLKYLLRKHKGDRETSRRLKEIFAHNGANFDWLPFVEYFLEMGRLERLEYITSGSIGIGVNIKLTDKVTLRLRDSLRLLQGSLDKVSKAFCTNYQKMEIPKEYKPRMEQFRHDHEEKYYQYLEYDVRSLSEALYNFWRMIYELEGSIGRLPMTVPALAMKIYRKALKEPIFTTWNAEVKELARRSYTGGRVECYRPGVYENIWVYDVNSMYPYAMKMFPYPASHRVYWTTKFERGTLGFYEVAYRQGRRDLPPRLTDEQTHELRYEGSGVFTTVELEQFIDYCSGEIDIIRGYVHLDTAPIFEGYVDTWYNLRLAAKATGNDALNETAKLMLNSLYGKFGQQELREEIVYLTNEELNEAVASGRQITPRRDGICTEQKVVECEYSFPGVASYVTAYARCTLYQYILENVENYIYCDTDSVHLTAPSIEESLDLGGMKLEKHGEGSYVGKKLYAIKDRKDKKETIKAKGIGRNYTRDPLSYSVFYKLARGELKHYKVYFNSFPTVRAVLFGVERACLMQERARTINSTPP